MRFSFSGREKGELLSGPGTVAAADFVRREGPRILPVGLRGPWGLTVGHDGGLAAR